MIFKKKKNLKKKKPKKNNPHINPHIPPRIILKVSLLLFCDVVKRSNLPAPAVPPPSTLSLELELNSKRVCSPRKCPRWRWCCCCPGTASSWRGGGCEVEVEVAWVGEVWWARGTACCRRCAARCGGRTRGTPGCTCRPAAASSGMWTGTREMFYLTTYSTHFIYGDIVKDHSDSERGNPLPPHRQQLRLECELKQETKRQDLLLFDISSQYSTTGVNV